MINFTEIFNEYQCCLWCLERFDVEREHSKMKIEQRFSDEIRSLIDASNLAICQLCHDTIESSIKLHEKITKKLEQYEFEHFEIGVLVKKELDAKDKELLSQGKIFKTIKQKIAEELGIIFTQNLNKPINHDFPDVTILINTKKPRPRFELQIRSMYILGRYNKYIRGIPQTKWPCTVCKGKGCDACSNSGQQYPFSVEKIISEPFFDETNSRKASFHGAGREDIDALMLGEGRPFVLEIKQPIIRNLDLTKIESIINTSSMVNVRELQFTEKQTIRVLKGESTNTQKVYRAIISLECELTPDMIHTITEFGKSPQIIQQRTPNRVSHRRADKIRSKTIYSVSVIESSTASITLEIKAQGGVYIKEFISGDEGRSIPSIFELINCKSTCVELDVIMVDQKGFFR